MSKDMRNIAASIRQKLKNHAAPHAYHVGEPPDQRAMSSALARQVDLSGIKARRAIEADFNNFDLVMAMDHDNYGMLQRICPNGMENKLQLFMQYAPHLNVVEVPDPYYGGGKGFEHVLDLIEEASEGLLTDIKGRML